MAQARIDTELDLQCFHNRMASWHPIKGIVALKVVCTFITRARYM